VSTCGAGSMARAQAKAGRQEGRPRGRAPRATGGKPSLRLSLGVHEVAQPFQLAAQGPLCSSRGGGVASAQPRPVRRTARAGDRRGGRNHHCSLGTTRHRRDIDCDRRAGPKHRRIDAGAVRPPAPPPLPRPPLRIPDASRTPAAPQCSVVCPRPVTHLPLPRRPAQARRPIQVSAKPPHPPSRPLRALGCNPVQGRFPRVAEVSGKSRSCVVEHGSAAGAPAGRNSYPSGPELWNSSSADRESADRNSGCAKQRACGDRKISERRLGGAVAGRQCFSRGSVASRASAR
jgi:hypothetical protein